MRANHKIINKNSSKWIAVLVCLVATAVPSRAHAINQLPIPDPKSNSYGLVATKKQPAPTDAATITTPGNGGSFSTSPITVSGLCKTGLLVQVYDNNVLVGSINCTNGSFSIQVTLFSGQNDLTATLFDDLDQAGPNSNKVSVNFNNASTTAFGQLITLTSTYGRRAADPGSTLTWPLQLTGGTTPYAFSIDWGDGTPADLKSEPLGGNITISHVYKQAGIYHVTIKVTDVNGVSAFLQVVAIANGKPTASAGSTNGGGKTTVVTQVLWFPAVISAILLGPAYWLGRRSELVSLHRKLEKDMENYKEL
jgi:hypothetical protein